jgi:flagellar biosynthesis GTPase FlhF
MGRKVAIPWHLLFSIGAGVLYFFCVLPRWYELMGDMPRALGMAGRIASGALIGLAALPVVFTLLRTRKPELGTPQLALSIRVWSIVAHVLAGVLIIGTAISEIWLSLDAAGQYLFGIYGAAAAIGVLGFFAFYLSFVAERPPPPPKPIKAKKPKKRRRKKSEEADEAAEDTEALEAEADEDTETEEAETVEAEAEETKEGEKPEQAEEPVAVTAESTKADAEPATEEAAASQATEASEATEEPRGGLRNRRPTGKGTHRMRRRRTRGGVAVDE